MKVAIYGGAKYGRLFAEELKKNGYEVKYFIDEYIDTKEIDGIYVLRIKDLPNEDTQIAVFNSVTTHQKKIKDNLFSVGFKNFIEFEKVFYTIPKALEKSLVSSNMWYKKKDMFNLKKITALKSLLSDLKSVDVLDEIIAFRQNTVPENYIMPMNYTEQYFPLDVSLFKYIEKIKMVDCGVYNGDTLKAMVNYAKERHLLVASIVAFEADTRNIDKLEDEVRKQKSANSDTEFILYPAGVWSNNTILNFSNDGNSASAVCDASDEGCIQVPVFSLDSTLQSLQPNYIKMDIEGAEQKAIKGARKIIKEYSPILAICLYHKPKDLWEIPLLINEINPNYDMYIRVYGHLGLETVLYCVPKVNKE